MSASLTLFLVIIGLALAVGGGLASALHRLRHPECHPRRRKGEK